MTVETQAANAPVDTSLNFGARHWSIVAIEGILIWLAAGAQVHGLNIITPTLSAEYGIDNNLLLYWATPATWGGVIAGYVVAKTCELKGAKLNILISLLVCGLGFGLLGTAGGSIAGFVALFFVVNFFGTGYGYVGGLNLIANWFPRKKNLALGFVTMGQTMSTALFVPILAWFIATCGVRGGFWAMAAIMFVMIPVVAVFVRNNPEEFGRTPDNLPVTGPADPVLTDERPPFTTRQLLKLKDVWLMAIGSGGVYVMLVGMMSQMVPRQISMGIEQGQAITNLSIAAFIGVPGAFLWGWLGQRFSSKTIVMVYTGWWIVAIGINAFLALNPVTLWISLVMLGLSFGGATNLTTSIVADKFPRSTFVGAFGIIQPLQGIVRSTAYAILAFGIANLGGYTGAYSLLIGVGVVTLILFALCDPSPIGETVVQPATHKEKD
ncbi:MAG: MFS transporter [Propionicimonas sp.]